MAKTRTYEKTQKPRSKAQKRRTNPERKNLQANRKAESKAIQAAKTKLIGSRKAQYSDVNKYYDIGNVPRGSNLSKYWAYQTLIPYFKAFRSGKQKLPSGYRYWDHNFLMEKYAFKGIEFGNWLVQEDRLNYVCALGIALYDLKNILGFSYTDVGLRGKLSLTFGSRGRPKALAHFSPSQWLINLTRYKEYGNSQGLVRVPVPENPKLVSFLRTGGVGSFGHEYGHALDYWIGGHYDQDRSNFALSRGRDVNRRLDTQQLGKKTPRGLMEQLIKEIIWEDYDKKILTRYYQALYNGTNGEYWIRRNEIFARAFEQWLSFEMNRKNQVNSFLHKNKYASIAYMDQELLEKVAPLFTKLVASIRQVIR